MVRTVEQSMAINHLREPCVIMSTAGMCNAGRIKHHLRNNIERPEATILFVGHQAEGTLGRQILDGKPRVRSRTDWAIIDKASGRPIRIPPEVAKPFLDG